MKSKTSILFADLEVFKDQGEIGDGINGKTIRVIQTDTQDLYAKKLFTNIEGSINDDKLFSVCDYLSKSKYPFYLPPSYISFENDDQKSFTAIFTNYMTNQSLHYIIEQQISEMAIDKYDSTQEYLILYGISCFLDSFHSSKKVHGSIKLTNVLLDEQFFPYVSDSCLFEIIPKQQYSKLTNKTIDYLVSLSPEALNNQPPTRESDIYSFGILILQVLNHQINVFSDISEEFDKIERLIQTNTKPTIPEKIPPKISEVLNSCFSTDPKMRLSASAIKKVFENILNEPEYIKRFNEFKQNLIPKDKELNQEISNLKRKADIGDLESMFSYGKQLFEDKNAREGMNYLRLAAKNGYVPAKNFYNNIRKDSSQNLNRITKDDFNDQKDKKTFTSLKDDPIFEQKSFDIEKIKQAVQNNIDIDEPFNYTQEDLSQKNFILTKGAIDRLKKLKKYIDAGVPVILEGPTGTSKTLSTEIICELTDRKLIRFNLSSETKSTDLLGRFVGESDSWAGIKMIPGPFVTAFEFGKTLLLDEINLGSTECLQFIEEALDSGVISVELTGLPLREIPMHPEFRLIATQNPNKGLFIHKRQDLGEKFKSRFQFINFPEFKDELFDIAVGLAEKFEYKEKNWEQTIKDLVSFHMKWSSLKEVENDIQCITVREIAACVKAFSEHQNIYDTIMTIYGARYQKNMKDKLKDEFRKFPNFKDCKTGDFAYPEGFPQCFHNSSLSDALKSILFSFNNHRHVILTGAEGSGLTQIARWISYWYQQKYTNEQVKSSNKEYFCFCTNETKCSDLIGKFKPSENLNVTNDNNELIKWKNGLLTEAVLYGFLAVLDNLDEAPATVLERLNGLLDQKFEDVNEDKKFEDGNEDEKFIFEIPENPKQRKVPINKNFRLLCTCNIDNLNQMSPAFINRFDVIVLENQIQDNEEDLKTLISMLMKQEKPSNFQLKQEIVDYVYEKVHSNSSSNQNQDTKLTMFQLSQLCKAVTRYTDFFNQKINMKSVVDFSINILNKNQDFKLPSKIEDYLISKLKEQKDTTDNKFFFLQSPNLKSLIAKIYAASLINLPVCLLGPTGVGKTSAARELARIRPTQNEANDPFLMHTFHAGTKPKDFYGITTISNEKVLFIDGTLTTAMVNGQTFIADEMNLASIPTMKSLAPALEPINNQFLYIAGVEEPIQVHKEFFFIACQNELGTNGRNAIPRSIASRFRYFYYPEQELNDISPICIKIAKSFYKAGEKPSFSEDEAAQVGKYMLELNKLKQQIIPQWSLRDITKLFLRIHYQEANKEVFKNITLYKNILFYTLSPVNKEDVQNVLNDVIKLIAETFSLSEDNKNELKECYNSIPKIEKNYLIKGSSSILINSFKNAEFLRKLPSLLNSMFQILLSDLTEPILLMGPSGFKTFLAQQFLDDAKIVTLNQESTVAQLLGSSAFLSKEEAKNFYIENICKICRIDQIPEYIEQFKNKELTKEKLKNIVNPIILTLPQSLKYAVNHLLDKLFDDNKGGSNNCVLSNLELEFRPGLFLSAILECKSLILKNLSNLPTIILERFNELFSGRHNLTLNEDIHNTFTSKTEKELSDISSNFRVFATCPPNSVNKLSEAVLSRFTVICIPAYKLDEQEIVLQSYINLNDLSFDKSLISILIKFAKKMDINLNKSFSFPQMINSVEMCSRLNINTSDHKKWIENLGIILFRLGYGLLENRRKTKATFIKIFEETDDNLKFNLPENLKSSISENPLCVSKSKDGYLGLQSKMSNIFFKSPNTKENNKKLAFTPMFSEMLDALHLGISINIPVIFEGMPGQGKQAAIDYISNMLGYQIINVIISRSTKVEDLFGKITITRDKKNNIKIKPIETKLVKVLEPNSESNNNSIIVFHNINNASSAVLEVLVSIFDQHQKDFLLPNGSTITKGQVKIVGIFNPQNGIFNREKLPSSLIYSSIYHIVNNPNQSELLSVIGKQFEDTEFGADEVQSFYENFMEIKGISDEANASPLTLSDIEKYKKFREVTYGVFDSDIVSLMLLAYRFVHHKTISDAISKINSSDMIFNPVFTFHPENKKLIISVKEKSNKYIALNSDVKENEIESIKEQIASLTLPERRCILFLAFSVLSKQACLVKGETASGKSHIIRLFAKMLGKKLNVYQMNSETKSSILTGQSVLSNQLSDEDINDINSALADLERIPEISEYINKNVQQEKWTRKVFSDLLEKISSNNYGKKYPNKAEIIESSKQKIIETIQPAKRFHVVKSSFIRALTEGEWVLFDGIESAPSEIIEKISPLCGDNPQLDLLECGEGYYFTADYLPGSNKINKNFHLFFTYNPTSQVENKVLDPDFSDNCASFTLPSIDSTPENTAQRVLGTMIKYYPEKISLEISKRYAMTHSYAKEESKKDSDSFAGDVQLTGRTTNFVSKEFIHHAKVCKDFVDQIYRPICYSMKYYYLNSYINTKKEKDFKQQLINEFSKEIDSRQFIDLTYEGLNLTDKYKEILIYLRNIQIYESDETKPFSFNFPKFVERCFQLIQINDIDFILRHINDTIDIIDNSEMNFTREFSQLKILSIIFEEIKNGKSNLRDENSSMKLNDENLLKTEQLNKPLSRLNLLCKLVPKESKCFEINIPRILYDSNFVSILKHINFMLKEESLDSFKEFISLLNSYPGFIPLIESIFPYDRFEHTKLRMIHYILPMIRILHDSKSTFNIFVSDEEIKFKYDKLALFEPTYIIEYDTELTLSSSSQIALSITASFDFQSKIPKDKFTDSESINSYFYNLTKYFVEDNKNIGKFLTSNKIFNFIDKTNPRANKISQLSRLLSIENLPSLVSIIWPIVYTFPKDIINAFSEYVLPLEKDTLLAFNYIYEIIDKTNIEQIYIFSKWMFNFGNKKSYLYQVVNAKFYINQNIKYEEALKIRDMFDNEIKYLKSAPKLLPSKEWPIDDYINRLLKEKDKIDIKIDTLMQQNEKLRLMKKLKPILEQLEKVTSEKYKSIRYQIYAEIKNDSDLSEEKIKFYNTQVTKFIDSIKLDDSDYAKNTICWPTFKQTKEISDYKSPTMILYQIMIWYSNIISILNKINKSSRQNVFECILELDKFDEVHDIAKFLTNRFLHIENSNKKELNNNEVSLIHGILNANFIKKIIDNKLIKEIGKLRLILNKLQDRNAIEDVNILSWIHKIANQYPPDFAISLPNFQPKDLIYLFVGYNENDADINCGPILKNTYVYYDHNNLIKELKNLLSTNFTSSSQCSIVIAKSILKNIVDKKSSPPDDFQKMMKFLTDHYYKNKQNNYVRIAIKVMEIAQKIDSQETAKLEFNDTFFFDEKWIKKEKYVNKYPSLVYWLCKNHLCMDRLRNIFENQQFSSDELPFWLFVLRLMSSESCITFDTPSTTNTGEALSQIISEEIRKKIRDKLQKSDVIGTKWLNIILPSPPQEIANQKYQSFYHMFYQFFLNLSDDKKLLQKETFDVKIEQLRKFVKKVCSVVFKDSLEAVFECPINSDDNSMMPLIRDPNLFIANKVESKMNEVTRDFLSSQNMKSLALFTSQLKYDVNSSIKNLQGLIDKEEAEKEKKFKEERAKFRKKELETMKKNILKSIKE